MLKQQPTWSMTQFSWCSHCQMWRCSASREPSYTSKQSSRRYMLSTPSPGSFLRLNHKNCATTLKPSCYHFALTRSPPLSQLLSLMCFEVGELGVHPMPWTSTELRICVGGVQLGPMWPSSSTSRNKLYIITWHERGGQQSAPIVIYPMAISMKLSR